MFAFSAALFASISACLIASKSVSSSSPVNCAGSPEFKTSPIPEELLVSVTTLPVVLSLLILLLSIKVLSPCKMFPIVSPERLRFSPLILYNSSTV